MKVIITLCYDWFSFQRNVVCLKFVVGAMQPWTTKGFTISALVRIYKIQELLVHALLLVVEKYF